jgi:LPS sulfotransferase NodH
MKNILIVANPRTGSTYLSQIVAQYTGYELYNEPWNLANLPMHPKLLEVVYDTLYEECSTRNDVLVKAHISHFHHRFFRGCDYIESLNKLKELEWYTIRLIRRDLFQAALSLTLAFQTGTWHSPYTQDKVTLDPTTFLNNCVVVYQTHLRRIVYNDFNFKFDETVIYEDFVYDPRTDFASLDICSVPLESISPIQVDPRAPKKKEIIENYDELQQIALDYAKTLNDDRIILDGFYAKEIIL